MTATMRPPSVKRYLVRKLFLGLLIVFFVAAGANHFWHAEFYEPLMPAYLPWHPSLIAISGVAEIVGGLGAAIRYFRRAAGWGLIVLLICVFPANLHAALHGLGSIPEWILWARLPFQAVLVAWVHWTCLQPLHEKAEAAVSPSPPALS